MRQMGTTQSDDDDQSAVCGFDDDCLRANKCAVGWSILATAAMPQVVQANTLGTAGQSETMEVPLAPGEGAEINAAMQKGACIAFNWSVDGGHANFDTHADAPGISYHGYEKGQQSTGQQGELVAAFDGKHGWFWRNRSAGTVTVTLRVDGAFSELKRVV